MRVQQEDDSEGSALGDEVLYGEKAYWNNRQVLFSSPVQRLHLL